MIRRVVAAVMMTSLVLVGALAANAQVRDIHIDSPSPQSGVPELSTVAVTGGGCLAADTVTVFFNSIEAGAGVAADDGSFSVSVTTPGLPEGWEEIPEGAESSIRVQCGAEVGDSGGVVVVLLELLDLEVTVDLAVIDPGDTVTVSGSGCATGVPVLLTSPVSVGGIVVETVADDFGSFDENFPFPEELVQGLTSAPINVFCNDPQGAQQMAVIAITFRQAELPVTGIPSREIVQVAVALLALGGALVIFSSTSRTDSHQ